MFHIKVLVSSLCYSLNEKEVLSPLLWLCTHTPIPCMSFSTNPFKTGNSIPKEICQVNKKKQKGKRNKSFCWLGLTEDQNVLLQTWRERGVAGEQETKSLCKCSSESHLKEDEQDERLKTNSLFFSLSKKDWIKMSPADGTVDTVSG